MKFLADEDLRDSIIRGVLRRLPYIDLVRAQDAGLRTRRDEILLEFAAAHGRILISQDVSTMMGSAVSRIKAGKAMPGVFLIPDTVPIGAAIDAIALIVECSDGEEWNDRVEYLPL